MKFITQISRVLVGGLFIFSGLIKLNDPVGFSFKLSDYFAADVLNLPFMQPFTLELALFIVVLEVLLGVALLVSFAKNLTLWLLLGMIIFFTFLTFYSAYFNKVTDCGCFGDAIPLTPWESFGKDVILTVLILIVFFNKKYIKPFMDLRKQGLVMSISLLLCVLFGNHVLRHLPTKDFRPYAVGKSIIDGRKSAEELGLKPTTYATVYTMKNINSGELIEVYSDAYVSEKWWEKKDWEIQSDETKTVVLEEGYEPPVHDFVITMDDVEITEEILREEAVFLVIAYKLEKTHREAFDAINHFATNANEASVPLYGLSASLPEVVESYNNELSFSFPFAVMDETALKTIIRANPGIVLLKKGEVAAKWHYSDLPDFQEVQELHL